MGKPKVMPQPSTKREMLIIERGEFGPDVALDVVKRVQAGWTIVRAEIHFEREDYPVLDGGAYPTLKTRKRTAVPRRRAYRL